MEPVCRSSGSARRAFALAFAGLFLATSGESQSRESSSELIAFLMRPDLMELTGMSTFACSEDIEDRAAANSLARLGPSVIPDIERALPLIESKAGTFDAPVHSDWLLYAYAKIDGPAAFSRLRTMMGNSALAFLNPAWDNSVALSLGLTSYVSKFHQPPPSMRFIYNNRIVFCHDQEPRFGLDQFIVAWRRNDRDLFERSLGPHALAALDSLLETKTWDRLHEEFWLGDVSGSPAVGYRFNVIGPWSEPAEILRERVVEDSADPELETLFKTGSGSECGTLRIRFEGDGRALGDGSLAYRVDNANLADLLGVVSSCAAE